MTTSTRTGSLTMTEATDRLLATCPDLGEFIEEAMFMSDEQAEDEGDPLAGAWVFQMDTIALGESPDLADLAYVALNDAGLWFFDAQDTLIAQRAG